MVQKKQQQQLQKSLPTVSSQLQQRLLTIFSETFNDVLTSNDFTPLLQEIKQALFNRDFEAAFAKEHHLQIYAARWSPTRALCYASVLRDIQDQIDKISLPEETHHHHHRRDPHETAAAEKEDGALQDKPYGKRIKMLSVGGCAAEHVAFAAHLHTTQSRGTLALIDAAPWAQVISLLQHRVAHPPANSKYASAAAKAAAKALLGEQQLRATFSQNDVLTLGKDQLAGLVGAASSEPLLVTLLFTLNELYTVGGIGRTTVFLKNMGEVLPHGSLLLVVDSPGSYSEAAIGKEKKKYPMQWLLKHTLLEVRTPGQAHEWQCLDSQDSVWFRLPQGLSYPIQLENMRYQMHLFRKKSVA